MEIVVGRVEWNGMKPPLSMSGLSQPIRGLRPVGVLRTTRFAPGESVAMLNPTYVYKQQDFKECVCFTGYRHAPV